MRFLKIINHKKFILTSILFSVYLIFNLLDGERGLISYFEKKEQYKNMLNKKEKFMFKFMKLFIKRTNPQDYKYICVNIK